jgi:riboflavin biosynthesis pyrimidine reductase
MRDSFALVCRTPASDEAQRSRGRRFRIRDFLRRKGISYISAGEDSLDLDTAVKKIGETFGMEELMLNRGGGLNLSFIRAGLCEEVSIALTPAPDAAKGAQTLFEADGSVWLRYSAKGPIS